MEDQTLDIWMKVLTGWETECQASMENFNRLRRTKCQVSMKSPNISRKTEYLALEKSRQIKVDRILDVSKKSTNKSGRTGCLVKVKSQQVKSDRILRERSFGRLRSIKYHVKQELDLVMIETEVLVDRYNIQELNDKF